MASTKSTRKHKHLQPVPTREVIQDRQIKEWTTIATRSGGCDQERQSALLLLLDAIGSAEADADSLALTARNVAFAAADLLVDDVIDAALQLLRAEDKTARTA